MTGEGTREPPTADGRDLFTLAQAAAIKGVSYHTASRAVRAGKLPARRLGRQALIAAEDLARWRPVYERKPHKYPPRAPDPTVAPLFRSGPDGPAPTADRDADLLAACFAALDPADRTRVLAFAERLRDAEARQRRGTTGTGRR